MLFFSGIKRWKLIAFSTIFFISLYYRSFACYLKQRVKYKALAHIKSKGNDLVIFMNKQIEKLITIKNPSLAFLPLLLVCAIGIAFL